MIRKFVLLLGCLPFLTACGPEKTATYSAPVANPADVATSYSEADYQDPSIPDSVLYDKILGCLVGSAIGDAMGAPTEMWNQWAIRETYGYVDSLDILMREASPEGPWDINLPAGAGTDDTRWKDLTAAWLIEMHGQRPAGHALELPAGAFAEYLTATYRRSIDRLRATAGEEPEPFEANMRQLSWLQEWAKVSRAYAAGDIDGYRDATARFYGGEMACAGLLYTPLIGAVYPGRPEAAYAAAYELTIFDIGYARDVAAQAAALTAVAFSPGAELDSFTNVLRDVDPAGFFRSRLLGRVSYEHYKRARGIVRQARRITRDEASAMSLNIPEKYPYDSLTFARTRYAYEQLGRASQDVAFHAGEINLINLTALLFSDLDFQRALEFVTNYGRDNDTVGAVTGSILGAYHGYSNLPRGQRELVLRVNHEVLGIDLEARARVLWEELRKRRE